MQAMLFIDSLVDAAATFVRDLPSDTGVMMLRSGEDGSLPPQAQPGRM